MDQAFPALPFSPEQLQSLVNDLPAMVYQLRCRPGGELSFVYVSSGCQELLGVEPEELLADVQVLLDLVEPQAAAFLAELFSGVDPAPPLLVWSGPAQFASGEKKWWYSCARPVLAQESLDQQGLEQDGSQADGGVLWRGLWLDVSALQLAEQADALAEANLALERLTNLDGLTQVANRRRFDHCLYKEWKRLVRDEQPLSLVLVEVDHFQAYGDRYGFLAGDQCLYRIAQMLERMALRPADLVSRYGAAEFAVLLPGTPMPGAEEVAKRIYQGMTQLRIDHDRSPTALFVTLSAGIVTTVPQRDALPTLLLEYAESALQEARHQGHNRYRMQMF